MISGRGALPHFSDTNVPHDVHLVTPTSEKSHLRELWKGRRGTFDGVLRCLDSPPRPLLSSFGSAATAPRTTSLFLVMTLGRRRSETVIRLAVVFCSSLHARSCQHADAQVSLRSALHSRTLRLPYCGSRIGLVFALHAASARASSITRRADMIFVQPRVCEWRMSICDANCTIVSVET